ncbi:MAG: radical SAM protein [Chitinivibrionales bacterium]|nr:radical SAM protein [Chitinivibrionales bacterium]MBD3357948.1 radical SAM protein [Chitinivibrionales bacterium]
MAISYQLPRAQRIEMQMKRVALKGAFGASGIISDNALISFLRSALGLHRYPEGQVFLEKGAVALKRAVAESNAKCRNKLVDNLFLNECVTGQKVRSHISRQIGFELPVLLVISPTMRCPLRCYGCYSAQYAKDSDLDYVVFDQLITEAKSLGIYFFVISGGEPFTYPQIHELFRKHYDAWFMVYTSGITLNQEGVRKLAALGNVFPCISVEGFRREVDERRGKGHFERVMQAFGNLRRMKVPFGFSATVTAKNSDLVMSDEFIEYYSEQGARVGWYFQYMPIGREPNFDLLPTPEQRIERYHRLCGLRAKHKILLSDFWNDGPIVGGCIAARRYLHVNHAGRVEPCVFCQFSIDSVYEKGLLEILKTSPLFAAVRKKQPYNDNYLRPCMILDNPHVLKEVVEKTGACETCGQGAKRLVNDLYSRLESYSRRYGELADCVWREKFEKEYKETLKIEHEIREKYDDGGIGEETAVKDKQPKNTVISPVKAEG